VIDGGAVNASWATGLTYAWGIGFNTDAADLWLETLPAGGGDDLDYRFTSTGENTGDTIDTTPWVDLFGGDMTYNPTPECCGRSIPAATTASTSWIRQRGPATGDKICPDFGTPSAVWPMTR